MSLIGPVTSEISSKNKSSRYTVKKDQNLVQTGVLSNIMCHKFSQICYFWGDISEVTGAIGFILSGFQVPQWVTSKPEYRHHQLSGVSLNLMFDGTNLVLGDTNGVRNLKLGKCCSVYRTEVS